LIDKRRARLYPQKVTRVLFFDDQFSLLQEIGEELLAEEEGRKDMNQRLKKHW
jgi:hypothetical protein